ncbi:uncharacterized protein DS421_7g212610 [Arachis hypogaea]|nr:uncharacterized protein DS421_7g212610 [Arachis hypogaea]
MADSSTPSTSQSDSKTKQPFHFRAKIEVQNIQVVANLRNLHQHTIKLSIKNLKRKQSNNTQEKMAARNQTKDLKCAIHLLSDKFRNMSEEKKAIVRDLEFGGLMHIPPLRVHHQLLRELANNFKLGENRLETGYGSFKITPRKIGHALGINATGDLFPEKVEYKKLSEDDKIIFRRFQGKTLKSLTDEMMEIGVGNEEERLMFKRIFILYIQMAFLLPTTINKISPIHLPPIFQMDSITERNWRGHVLTFIVKGITDYKEKKKKAIDGCLFALMIIYFHLSKNKGKKRAERPPKPWIANWSKEQLVERITAEREKILVSSTSSSETETTTDSDSSTSESETQEDSEDSGRKHPSKKGKKTQPKKKKVVVEDSPPEEDQYFDGYSTSENQADLRSTEVFVPASQTTTVPELQETPESDFEPTPLPQIEGTTETTPKPPPQQLQETTPTLPLAPTKIHPAAEDVAALMMMALTASYVPKTDPVPSFSLGLTDSSQEGASTQETERAKSPEAANLLEQLDNLITDDMKQKCYIWGTRLKTDADGNTNEYEHMCTLIAQDEYILIRMHLASLQAKSYIESEIVSAICLIFNQKNEKRFQEQIYCPPHPPDIVNMALSDHPNGEFTSPKTNKEFRVEDYPSFIPFIDAKKLTSHPYGYVFSKLITYAGGEPLKKGEKEKEIKASYVKISGQKSSYDCAIYVMKWLELIEPENIKKGKYEWDNWPQEEVDHYRVEYASRILLSEMNKERDQAIRESNAIRLSKPSSVLLSPFCQINSADIETA